MKAYSPALTENNDLPATRLSVLVLIRHWPLTQEYQAQLKALAQLAVVHELILVGEQVHQLTSNLAAEPKLRTFQLKSSSLALMAEAAAFEAAAEVLLILDHGVSIPERALQAIPKAIAGGFYFGGLICECNHWGWRLLTKATVYCKALFWFRFIQGYFVSRKVYHHSGGFKQDGRLISFAQLLCKQKMLSRYTFIFY